MQAARDRQKSYADKKRKLMDFQVGDKVMLKVSPWKGVVRFGKRGKLNLRYVGPFRVLEKVRTVAYKLELSQELSRIHNTFHVSNLKKCYSDDPLTVPLDGLRIDDQLHFVEEPVEIMDRKVKRLKRSYILIIKVRWNSKRGLEFTWECEDQFKQKYPHLFTNRASSPTTRVRGFAIFEIFTINYLQYPTSPKNERISVGVFGGFQFFTASVLLGSTCITPGIRSMQNSTSRDGGKLDRSFGNTIRNLRTKGMSLSLGSFTFMVFNFFMLPSGRSLRTSKISLLDVDQHTDVVLDLAPEQLEQSSFQFFVSCSDDLFLGIMDFHKLLLLVQLSAADEDLVLLLEITAAIKSRFGGNDESKKMQKYLLKQQFKSFSVSNSKGLHKIYDRSLPSSWSQVSLIMRTKPGVDTLNFDDLYNNLRVFESNVKGSIGSSSSTQNVAFVSSDNTNSTNEVNTTYGVSTSSGHNSQKEGSSSYTDDLSYSSLLINLVDKHKDMVTIDGEGVDWTGHAEDDIEDNALMAFNTSYSGSDTEVTYCSKVCKES
nr:putative reverse transcriptase domain-containing protein [Tanacetum cinerariifolium]